MTNDPVMTLINLRNDLKRLAAAQREREATPVNRPELAGKAYGMAIAYEIAAEKCWKAAKQLAKNLPDAPADATE